MLWNKFKPIYNLKYDDKYTYDMVFDFIPFFLWPNVARHFQNLGGWIGIINPSMFPCYIINLIWGIIGFLHICPWLPSLMNDKILSPWSLYGVFTSRWFGIPTLNQIKVFIFGVFFTKTFHLKKDLNIYVRRFLRIVSMEIMKMFSISFGIAGKSVILGCGFNPFLNPSCLLPILGCKFSFEILLISIIPCLKFRIFSELAFYFIYGRLVIKLFFLSKKPIFIFHWLITIIFFYNTWLEINVQMDKVNMELQHLCSLIDHSRNAPCTVSRVPLNLSL